MTILNENSHFGDWAELWAKKKKVGMKYTYIRSINSFLNHLHPIYEIPVRKVKAIDIESIITELAVYNPNTKKPSSKKLLKNVKYAASSIIEFAIKNCDTLYRNPANFVDIPSDAIKNTRTSLPLQEQELIMSTPHRARLSALVMLTCGLRVGEMIALKWENIDFENRVIYVRQSAYNINGNKLKIKDGTKNGKTRNITIPNILYQPLWTEYMRKRNKTDFVSTKADGVSMHSRSSWKNMWDSYTKQLGIKFTAHQLRHTYASMLYAAGVDVKSASELLGHSDVEITIKIYTHLAKETKIISIVKYNQFLDDNFVTNN